MRKAETNQAEARLTAALRAHADPERATQEKRYQKSVWEHWGVPLPKMDLAIRETVKGLPQPETLELARRLWRQPVWDLKIVAGRLLAQKSIEPDARVWRFVLDRLMAFAGWAVADNLASIASRCLIADEARLDEVERWIESPHLWTRRAALVFTLAWMKQDRDPERMLGWSARLKGDPEWFIQKAIGWQLRELSKRDNARVRRFLKDHGAAMKAFARKEASKYL